MPQYYIPKIGKISLSSNDFITKGGEGSIFGKGTKIYKIYTDQKKTIPEGKIRELQTLAHPNILTPIEALLNNKNNIAGFTMKWQKDTIPLCKLFTNDFRKRKNINKTQTVELIKKIQETINFIHSKKCLIVDGNELNYLVSDHNFNIPYFIDTDSYQTPTYPATAIMPNIRDYHNNSFSEGTDWFSFAIISFLVFVGIHPFKGSYPGYAKYDLQKRMMDNKSVMNKKATIPKTARDFSYIPNSFYKWYIDLFEKGERKAPPCLSSGFMITIPKQYKAGEDKFNIKEIASYGTDILYYQYNVVKLGKEAIIDSTKYICGLNEEIIVTKRKSIPIFIDIHDNKLNLRSDSAPIFNIEIGCTDKMIIENILYLKNEDKLLEVSFNDGGKKIFPCIENVWPISPNASTLYSNVIYQNTLDKSYLIIPSPPSRCHYIQVKELDGYKIIDAKYSKSICCLIAHKNNQYDRIILRFDANFANYDCRIIKDIDYLEINFIVKNNGVVAFIQDETTMEIFSNKINNKNITKIENANLPMPLKLCTDGNRVMFFKENKLFTISMK